MDPRIINSNDFFLVKEPEERIKFILRYAILAPSTHNTQPWLFHIEGSECEIFYDKKYVLPNGDPKTRDLFISMGCMLENLTIAAKYFCSFGNLETFSGDNSHLVAKFKLADNPNNAIDENFLHLLNTITKRVNARGKFTKVHNDLVIANEVRESLPDQYTKDIQIDFITDTKKIESIADLTAEGMRYAYSSSEFRKEMSKWMKNSLTMQKEGIPGYALRMSLLFSFILPTLVRHVNIGNLLGKLNKKTLMTAPIVTVLSSKINNSTGWLNVGRIAERMMLDINSHNLNTSIYVASIEMGNLHTKLMEITGITADPQFLFVIGKVDYLHKPTPRHQLEDKLI